MSYDAWDIFDDLYEKTGKPQEVEEPLRLFNVFIKEFNQISEQSQYKFISALLNDTTVDETTIDEKLVEIAYRANYYDNDTVYLIRKCGSSVTLTGALPDGYSLLVKNDNTEE